MLQIIVAVFNLYVIDQYAIRTLRFIAVQTTICMNKYTY